MKVTKPLSYNRKFLFSEKLDGTLNKILDKLHNEAADAEIEIFYALENDVVVIAFDLLHYSWVYKWISINVYQYSGALLFNRQIKPLSAAHLLERDGPASFYLDIEVEKEVNYSKIPSIKFDFVQSGQIILSKEQWEIDAEANYLRSFIKKLMIELQSAGVNPFELRSPSTNVCFKFDKGERSIFCKIIVGILLEFEWVVLRDIHNEVIHLQEFIKRNDLDEILLDFGKIKYESDILNPKIRIVFGKKFNRPNKNELFIRIADNGICKNIAEIIINICSEVNISTTSGGSLNRTTPRINIHKKLLPSFTKILSNLAFDRSDIVILDLKGKDITSTIIEGLSYEESYDICLIQLVNGSKTYISSIEVAVWHQIQRFDKEILACNRPSSIASRVTKFSDIFHLKSMDNLLSKYPDPLVNNFPIDVVYTWVDDSDPTWMEEKRNFELQIKSSSSPSSTLGRYRNRDELLYSLRSIEMYAPFVRKIYIVTSGQIPSWFNAQNERAEIIFHKDIFSDLSNLPTFNSHSIESQLHHIKGLSEHFIYFNDDMLLGNSCVPSDFFDSNGIAKIRPEPLYIIPELVLENDAEYIHAAKNAVEIMRRDFGVSPSNTMRHIPYAVRKSIMFELEELYASEFSRTARNKFRSTNDISPISFFYCHYAFMKGLAIDGKGSHRYIPLWSKTVEKVLKEVESTRSFKFICINDSGVLPENQIEVDQFVLKFLQKCYPFKSKFEL